MSLQENLFPPETFVTPNDRQQKFGHKSCVLWFTGLSGAGKSTLASALERRLYDIHVYSYILDGDRLRKGLNKDLDFSPEGRAENIRRLGEVSRLMMDAGLITIVAAISPYREDRANVRQMFEPGNWFEVYVKCGLDICMQRDPKGIYAKAAQGLIPNFTGVTAPYEAPASPDLLLDTENCSIDECVEILYDWLKSNGFVSQTKE